MPAALAARSQASSLCSHPWPAGTRDGPPARSKPLVRRQLRPHPGPVAIQMGWPSPCRQPPFRPSPPPPACAGLCALCPRSAAAIRSWRFRAAHRGSHGRFFSAVCRALLLRASGRRQGTMAWTRAWPRRRRAADPPGRRRSRPPTSCKCSSESAAARRARARNFRLNSRRRSARARVTLCPILCRSASDLRRTAARYVGRSRWPPKRHARRGAQAGGASRGRGGLRCQPAPADPSPRCSRHTHRTRCREPSRRPEVAESQAPARGVSAGPVPERLAPHASGCRKLWFAGAGGAGCLMPPAPLTHHAVRGQRRRRSLAADHERRDEPARPPPIITICVHGKRRLRSALPGAHAGQGAASCPASVGGGCTAPRLQVLQCHEDLRRAHTRVRTRILCSG